MIPTDTLRDLTHHLLDAARKAGASEADAIAVAADAVSIDVRAGRLEQAERANGVDIGLRVLLNGRQACVSSSDTSPATLVEMAGRAVAIAREAPLDDTLGLADPADLSARRDAAGLELEDTQTPDPSPAELQARALEAEAAALAQPGVTQTEAASAAFVRRGVWIAASNGFSGGYRRSSHATTAIAIAGTGTGMERDWSSESRAHAGDLPTPDQIGALAGTRAAARIGARRPPTGPVPILFDERVSATLIGHLLAAINGSAIARGASWLRDADGQPVLPPGIDLTEDPRIPRLGASRPFDAEGLPCARRRLVADGVLVGWVLDLGTGRKLGLPSTGNAARGTSAPPQPATSNVILTPGPASREALIADMGRGLLVTSLLGASINPTTGDYSRGAAGFWVEGGQIVWPVNECTIAGNLREMLMQLTPANDAKPWRVQAVPSLLVEGMTVAGA